jgi:hypothetical protein
MLTHVVLVHCVCKMCLEREIFYGQCVYNERVLHQLFMYHQSDHSFLYPVIYHIHFKHGLILFLKHGLIVVMLAPDLPDSLTHGHLLSLLVQACHVGLCQHLARLCRYSLAYAHVLSSCMPASCLLIYISIYRTTFWILFSLQ